MQAISVGCVSRVSSTRCRAEQLQGSPSGRRRVSQYPRQKSRHNKASWRQEECLPSRLDSTSAESTATATNSSTLEGEPFTATEPYMVEEMFEAREACSPVSPAWEVGKVNLNADVILTNRSGLSQSRERLLRSHQASISACTDSASSQERRRRDRQLSSGPRQKGTAQRLVTGKSQHGIPLKPSFPCIQEDPLPVFADSLEPLLLPSSALNDSLLHGTAHQLQTFVERRQHQPAGSRAPSKETPRWLQRVWEKMPGGTGLTRDESTAEAPFCLELTCLQSTVLLNVLAFGYAATAVVVKAMQGGAGEAQAATLGEAATSAAAAVGGLLSVSTSIEFAVRFAAAAVASSALMWLTRPQGSLGEARLATQGPAHEVSGRHKNRRTQTDGKSSSAWGPGVDLGVWMFVTYAAQAVGLQTTSAHDAALILTASVVLVPLLEAVEGSKMHWSVWAATVLACSGLLLLEGGSAEAAMQVGDLAAQGALSQAPQWSVPAGHLWCLLGAVGSAVHVVRSEKHCASHSPLELVTLQLGTTAVLGALWLGLSLYHSAGGAGEGVTCLGSACAALPLGMLLLAGPLGTGLCEWLELEALQYVKASTATLILTSSPLWASLLAFLTLGETITATTMLGGGLILAASLQVQLLGGCKEEA